MTDCNCLVVGCSFTAGTGLDNEKKDPQLWVNRLCNYIGVNSITNLARAGANNQWIFLETIGALVKNNYDLVIVAWTTFPRFYFNIGLELYSVDTDIKNTTVVNTNVKNYDKKFFTTLYNDLLTIHNDHWAILELVKYVNVLLEIQSSRNKEILFVNNLLPWPNNYFTKKQLQLPSDLSKFEQNILSVETRDDEEIFALYNMIHSHYDQYNGIQQNKWLNLYNNFDTMKIDTVSDTDKHPGYASQALYSDYLIERYKESNFR